MLALVMSMTVDRAGRPVKEPLVFSQAYPEDISAGLVFVGG